MTPVWFGKIRVSFILGLCLDLPTYDLGQRQAAIHSRKPLNVLNTRLWVLLSPFKKKFHDLVNIWLGQVAALDSNKFIWRNNKRVRKWIANRNVQPKKKEKFEARNWYVDENFVTKWGSQSCSWNFIISKYCGIYH